MAIDNITLSRIDTLHPKIRQEVKDIYLNEVVPTLTNITCRFAYTLRTFQEQDALYAQGRTKLYDNNGKKLGIVTKAKGGQSIHNYGLAFDIVLLVNGGASWDDVKDFDKDGKPDWMEVVNIYKRHGYTWGGDWKFKDSPHLEKSGYDWRTLLAKYNAGDFIPGTKYVNI
jgi:peptidoglycan L-alanyl-D-glutamate endopeptidase CwlK